MDRRARAATPPGCIALSRVQQLVAGQRVALVGNAESLFSGPPRAEEIDGHDLVVRFNLGVPGDPEKDVWRGRKMDVWGGYASPWRRIETVKVGPDKVARRQDYNVVDLQEWNERVRQVWVVPFVRWKPAPGLEGKVFGGYGMMREAQQVLSNKGSPTSGFTVAYMLVQHCEPASVDLYGFDFWQTRSAYSQRWGGGHAGAAEREWLTGRVTII